jgi:hypothetical protein
VEDVIKDKAYSLYLTEIKIELRKIKLKKLQKNLVDSKSCIIFVS